VRARASLLVRHIVTAADAAAALAPVPRRARGVAVPRLEAQN
jgi:hypothetical protein